MNFFGIDLPEFIAAVGIEHDAIPIAQALNVRPSKVIFADQRDPVLEFVTCIFHHGGYAKDIIRGVRRDEGLFRANSEPLLLAFVSQRKPKGLP